MQLNNVRILGLTHDQTYSAWPNTQVIFFVFGCCCCITLYGAIFYNNISFGLAQYSTISQYLVTYCIVSNGSGSQTFLPQGTAKNIYFFHLWQLEITLMFNLLSLYLMPSFFFFF